MAGAVCIAESITLGQVGFVLLITGSPSGSHTVQAAVFSLIVGSHVGGAVAAADAVRTQNI